MLSVQRVTSKAFGAFEGIRTFYFPRKHWFPWRVRLVRQRQAAVRAKRHLWPRRSDSKEEPIFGDKDQDVLAFTEKEIRISFKKLVHYARLMKRKQIQDAYEWVDSLARMKSEPILKLLEKAMEECRDRRGWDLARTYIYDPQPGFGFYVKNLRKHSRGRYGIMKSPRNRLTIRVRQYTLEVNWMAKVEHEYIPNYKVLQAAFDKLDIARNVPVDQLIRGKYQDNLEFLQWLKCYWEKEGGAGHRQYDAVAVRADKTLPPWAKPLNIFASRGFEKENQKPCIVKDEVRPARRAPVPHERTSNPTSNAQRQLPSKTPRSMNSSLNSSLNTSAAENETLKAKLNDQKEEILDLRANLDGLERERDYYFRKLRDVEILCLTLKANMDPGLKAEKVVEDVQGILYAENEVEAEMPEAESNH